MSGQGTSDQGTSRRIITFAVSPAYRQGEVLR
jgi:hypothetical protein